MARITLVSSIDAPIKATAQHRDSTSDGERWKGFRKMIPSQRRGTENIVL